MTMAVAHYTSCTTDADVGAMMAFTRAPSVVLRCPTYSQAPMARIVETPAAIFWISAALSTCGWLFSPEML